MCYQLVGNAVLLSKLPPRQFFILAEDVEKFKHGKYVIIFIKLVMAPHGYHALALRGNKKGELEFSMLDDKKIMVVKLAETKEDTGG